jgi:integrase/recombinase XerD
MLLAQVRLGQYRTREERIAAAVAKEAGVVVLPTFEKFAVEWMDRRRVLGGKRGRGLSESAEADLTWRLGHLNAWFGSMRLNEVTEEEVERYATAKRAAKVRDGGLGATSTNKTLATLEAVFATAVRYRLIDRNPADGYRVPGAAKKTAHLTSAAQILRLLDAARDLDRGRRGREGHGRALLATLVFAGLRISEALALTWRDVDLGNGAIRVRGTKTENADRTVYLLAPLREELVELKLRRGGERDAYVFGTKSGKKDSPSNVRTRLVAPALKAANAALEKAGEEAGPEHLTPHGLRHTFASLLLAIGENPRYVMGQLGHADPTFTLRVYAKEMDRRDGEPERLKALVLGEPIDVAADPAQVPGSNGLTSSSAM